MNPLSILGLGLLLGVRHATDADHVVAISTIVAQQKRLRSASIIGALWGIGHSITVFIVGVGIIIFHLIIPPRIGLLMEFIVALALIVLGILNLTGILQKIITKLTPGGHSHEHIHLHILSHDPHIHVHEHTERTPTETGKFSFHRLIHEFGWFQLARPVVIGLIHGLAGSAAIALLILSSITNPQIALIYLLIFGLGTMIGMMIITTLLGLPIIFSAGRFTHINRHITTVSGLLSLAFGLYLAWEIGVNSQLFGAHPVWSPR
jgi:high-affinity nickel permease